MHKTLSLFIAAVSASAIALLAACSSGGPQVTSALPSSSASQSHSLWNVLRSGAAPKFATLIRQVPATRRVGPDKGKGDLFVDDFNNNAVEILKNKTFANVGSITSDTNGPDGDWYDKHGLYVADWSGIYIAQYKSPPTESFRYSAGMTDPVDVATDSQGNVYEADYNYPSFNGFINEYAQGSNTVAATCSPGGAVEGVAVDRHGNVFGFYNSGSAAFIVEYKGGLSGCKGTVLPITFHFAGGMVFDKHGNLIVCDQNGPAVDVIAPPYQSTTTTLGSGYTDPFHVTIDKKNTRAYVVDLGAAVVDVLKYPSGTNVATLGPSNGLSLPSGAVDGSNFVP